MNRRDQRHALQKIARPLPTNPRRSCLTRNAQLWTYLRLVRMVEGRHLAGPNERKRAKHKS